MMGPQVAGSSADYFSTPRRRDGESLTDYAERLKVYDANYSPPKLVEPAKPKPRYRAKAWSSKSAKREKAL